MAISSIWHLLMLLVLALVWIHIDHTRLGDRRRSRGRQGKALQHVFSAETHRGTEAEFVNERLPQRLPSWLIALVVAFASMACLWPR